MAESSKWQTAVFVLIGVVAGGVLSGLVQSRQHRAARELPLVPSSIPATHEPSNGEDVDRLRQRLTVIETRLSEQADASMHAQAPPPTSAPSSSAQSLRAMRSESQSHFRRETGELLSRFQSEASDPQWAPTLRLSNA